MDPRLFKVRKDWAFILRKAWSVKLLLLAGLLTGLETFVQIAWTHGLFALPPWGFPVLMGVIVCAALVARVLAQKGFD